jgi:hypothetical protein
VQQSLVAAGHHVVAAGGAIELFANTLGWIKALAIAAGIVLGIVSIVVTFAVTRGNIYKTVGAGIAAFVLAFMLTNFALGVTFAKNTYEEVKTNPPVDAGINTSGIGN